LKERKMAINLIGANKYFKVHAKSKIWKEFSEEQKTGGIENAKQHLSRELRRAMKEDEPPYEYGDERRDEYAVYEQALFILTQIGIVDGSTESVQSLAPTADEPEVRVSKTHGKWSPEALRWLGYSGVIMT